MADASDRLIALDLHIVVEHFGNDDGMAVGDSRLAPALSLP
jgi:hypothetical protein